MKSISDTPDEKNIYVWNIIGSVINALLSVVILILVTRMVDDVQADIFSIAWTIGQLMATVGTFQLRMYQATDVKEVYKFQQYLIFRFITIFIMMVSSYLYIVSRGYNIYKTVIILIVCLFRAIEALDDVYEGWFQQKERLDLVGKAITYRVIISLLAFGVILKISKDVMYACVALLIGYILCFFWFDVRYYFNIKKIKEKQYVDKGWKWILGLTIEGAPLFINAFLLMSITNEPKMVIDSAIERGVIGNGIQTIFNILFMPASFLSLAYIIFRPLITKMAIMWNTNEKSEFVKILKKISIGLLIMGVAILIGSALLGIPILSIVYAVDLSKYKTHLLVLILGGCFYTFSTVFDNALVVIRKQYILIVPYFFTWIYIKLVSDWMLSQWKVMGAAITYTSAMIFLLVLTAILFVICLNKEKDWKRSL